MDGLLQFALAEPDKVFKHSREEFLGVCHLEVGLHAFGSDGRLKQELHRGECTAVSQPVGRIL